MPAQKRPRETTTPPPSPPPLEAEKADDSLQGCENHDQEQAQNADDSEGSSYSSDEEKDEYIYVKLAEIRKEVQCPICLGIIRKTRTVMECLHRFCRECIDKSMRLGNNECPACRTHCASRRSLRDDPNYDALIAALYPDIDKYEEEELAFHEEEKARNKLIQASIAQTFRRQAEALGKKRTSARATAATFVRRQGSCRNMRIRRNQRAVEHHGSDEEEGANGHDASKDSSSADEHSAEVRPKRYKRSGGGQNAQPSSGANADVGGDDNDSEVNRDLLGASSALGGGTEFLAWGRGGMRSNTRHGGPNSASGRLSRTNRVARLVNHLQSSQQNPEEVKIHLMLVSLDEEKIPKLIRPYLCCGRTASVKHLCQYVSMQTSVEDSELEMLIVKDYHPPPIVDMESTVSIPPHIEKDLLDQHQTLEEIQARHYQRDLILGYQRKAQAEGNL